MYSAFAAWGYSKEPSSRKSSHVVGGRDRYLRDPWQPLGLLPKNWGGNDSNCTGTCMVLKATDNDMRHVTLCHDEFRGPRSGLCESGAIELIIHWTYLCSVHLELFAGIHMDSMCPKNDGIFMDDNAACHRDSIVHD
ncbi:hypothetical protein TNCV_2799741 [Trichonephila clavipes]|nr:hypothetical protein TNCV_2799741 [Trichonephila clavipes]